MRRPNHLQGGEIEGNTVETKLPASAAGHRAQRRVSRDATSSAEVGVSVTVDFGGIKGRQSPSVVVINPLR